MILEKRKGRKMPQKKLKVAYATSDMLILIGCMLLGYLVIAGMIITKQNIFLLIAGTVILSISSIGILGMLIFRATVEDGIIKVRSPFGRKFQFSCSEIRKVQCSKSKSMSYGVTYYIDIYTETENVQVDSKMAGFQLMAEYLLCQYEQGILCEYTINQADMNLLYKFKTRLYPKKKDNKKTDISDGKMCQIRLVVCEIDDKAILKVLSPVFVWVILIFIELVMIGKLSQYYITVPLFFLTGISIIPIFIYCYKKTAVCRKPKEYELYAIFIIAGDIVSMNGKRVMIMENGNTENFSIMRDKWSGYAVRNNKEFETFIRVNKIPCNSVNKWV